MVNAQGNEPSEVSMTKGTSPSGHILSGFPVAAREYRLCEKGQGLKYDDKD